MSDDDKDAIARLIAAAIYRPQPHMSGDIFHRLGALRERGCRDAAEAVAEYLKLRTDDDGLLREPFPNAWAIRQSK